MVQSGGVRRLNNAIELFSDKVVELSFHKFADEVLIAQETFDTTSCIDPIIGKLKGFFSKWIAVLNEPPIREVRRFMQLTRDKDFSNSTNWMGT
jgi:hypothetical protein